MSPEKSYYARTLDEKPTYVRFDTKTARAFWVSLDHLNRMILPANSNEFKKLVGYTWERVGGVSYGRAPK
jgi:hypothetical protein